jgi:hypothetical protein
LKKKREAIFLTGLTEFTGLVYSGNATDEEQMGSGDMKADTALISGR